MHITSLPPEIVVLIAEFLGLEPHPLDEERKFPGAWLLYAACSAFRWLGTMESRHVDERESTDALVSVDIVGRLSGHFYEFLSWRTLEEYAFYALEGCAFYVKGQRTASLLVEQPASNLVLLSVNGERYRFPRNACSTQG